jgi:sulfur carrier protein ThiS
MGTTVNGKQCVQITLLRPDVGQQTFKLPEGATLADLLREAGTAIGGANIMIDGRPVEEVTKLNSGMVITIVPETSRTRPKRSWQDTIGFFADDPTFEEMVAEGRAIREADRIATLEEMDREAAAREDS